MIWEHSRFSDDEIYLNENNYNKPKQTHKKILKIIKSLNPQANQTILDCGCATGELTIFLVNNLKELNISGFDISPKMICKAKQKVPGIEFFVQDLTQKFSEWLIQPKKDIVVLSGVIQIFDDFEYIINNLILCTNKKGNIIITLPYNKDPIDVIMRYRRFKNEKWESGWNITCKESIENFLKTKKEIKNFYWDDVTSPDNLPKRKNDPMRKWTVNIDGDNTTVVGSSQIINQTILVIKLN